MSINHFPVTQRNYTRLEREGRLRCFKDGCSESVKLGDSVVAVGRRGKFEDNHRRIYHERCWESLQL